MRRHVSGYVYQGTLRPQDTTRYEVVRSKLIVSKKDRKVEGLRDALP
jgi:hypothetical protein